MVVGLRPVRHYLAIATAIRRGVATDMDLGVTAAATTIILTPTAGRWVSGTAAVVVVL